MNKAKVTSSWNTLMGGVVGTNTIDTIMILPIKSFSAVERIGDNETHFTVLKDADGEIVCMPKGGRIEIELG